LHGDDQRERDDAADRDADPEPAREARSRVEHPRPPGAAARPPTARAAAARRGRTPSWARGPRRAARGGGRRAELGFDPEEPVVLRDALRARWRPGLDLARAGRDREIGDPRVLGLAGAVAD